MFRYESATAKKRNTGTLMWIGDRSTDQARDAYDYCESNSPQIAYRATMQDAIARPASHVRQILIYRPECDGFSAQEQANLTAVFPDAYPIEMISSLGEGQGRSPGTGLLIEAFYWHRWNQVLPEWLAPKISEPTAEPVTSDCSPRTSLAVVAANHATAETLMDIASSVDAVSIWCRNAKSLTARNFSVVWWDDSVAAAASSPAWRLRIAEFEKHSTIPSRHVWLANAPRSADCRQANAGGIETVISKPYRIGALLATLLNNQVVSTIAGSVSQKVEQHRASNMAA